VLLAINIPGPGRKGRRERIKNNLKKGIWAWQLNINPALLRRTLVLFPLYSAFSTFYFFSKTQKKLKKDLRYK